MRVKGCVLLAAVCFAFCTACEYGGVNVSGTWNVKDKFGDKGTLILSQLGSVVTGRLEAYGYSVPMTGRVEGKTLTMGVEGQGHDLTLRATVNGDRMEGTLSDSGTGLATTFTGVRQ